MFLSFTLQNQCLSDLSFLAAFVADPKSTGSVSLDENGGLNVNVNYLSDLGDLDAFGEAAKTAYLVKNSMDPAEPTFPQSPNDPQDPVQNCPLAYQEFSDFVLDSGGIDNPLANVISTVQPNTLEALVSATAGCCPPLNGILATGASFEQARDALVEDAPQCGLLFALSEGENPCAAPNAFIGSVLGATSIISPHHFAGTARVGDVINEEFKVTGVNRLYVVDASAIPTTPRLNTMATTMMLGRLAGVAYVQERLE